MRLSVQTGRAGTAELENATCRESSGGQETRREI